VTDAPDRPRPLLPLDSSRQVIAAAAASLSAMPLVLADELERVARATGDNRCRHAAQILRGRQSGGRPPIDDDDALAEVERLIAAGKPERTALGVVARQMQATGASQESIRHRLRRKLRKKRRTKQVLSGVKCGAMQAISEGG
jgi:hypothetical protein